MVKCMCNVAVSETEELICDSDSEEQCVSQDSDVGDADDLSDDYDSIVLAYHLWHDSRSKDRTKIILLLPSWV
jgi:hypothetical protein